MRLRYVAGILFFAVAALPYLFMLKRGRHEAPVDREAEEISILSPHRREVRLEYSRGFREWMKVREGREVSIRWLDAGGTSKMLKDLESRFATSPQSPGVDLLFGGGVSPFLSAVQQGWLQSVEVPRTLLDAIPERCAGAPVYDESNRWFGVALSGFGILYNQPLVDRLKLPKPDDWDVLGRPEYFSWVGSGDPRSSGSVHMCYEIILQAYGFERGWSLLTRICGNVRTFGEAGGTVPREVAVGEIAAGMVIDQYAQTVIDSVGSELLVFALPSRNTIVGPDSIGMIRNTGHAGLAAKFIEFVLSGEGQRLLYQPVGVNGQVYALHRMPVVEAQYSEAGAPANNPYNYPAGLVYDDAKGSKRWNTLNDLMGVWLIDAHGDLRKAWKRVCDQGCRPSDVEALCRPPIGEADLASLGTSWKDPRQKQEIMQGWAREAQARYRGLARGENIHE